MLPVRQRLPGHRQRQHLDKIPGPFPEPERCLQDLPGGGRPGKDRLRIEPALADTDPPGNILTISRPTEPRVPPLPEAEWSAEQRALVERYAPDGVANNALRTLIRVPSLADRVYPLLTYIANDSTLSPRHRTMLILRTAWLAQSANLWSTYASGAAAAGLSA